MKKKTDAELAKLLVDTRAESRTVRFQAAASRPQDPSQLGKHRRTIARVLTEQRSRKAAH
jgi:ribosomal protein L29